MRHTLLVAAFALLANACSSSVYVRGSADFTSTPQAGEAHSGALPLTALVCTNPNHVKYTAGVRLGNGCDLHGRSVAFRGRNASGAMSSQLTSETGLCALPTTSGPLSIRVDTATLERVAASTNITVGGTTSDARYVTYRFSGSDENDAANNECDEVLRE